MIPLPITTFSPQFLLRTSMTFFPSNEEVVEDEGGPEPRGELGLEAFAIGKQTVPEGNTVAWGRLFPQRSPGLIGADKPRINLQDTSSPRQELRMGSDGRDHRGGARGAGVGRCETRGATQDKVEDTRGIGEPGKRSPRAGRGPGERANSWSSFCLTDGRRLLYAVDLGEGALPSPAAPPTWTCHARSFDSSCLSAGLHLTALPVLTACPISRGNRTTLVFPCLTPTPMRPEATA
jgi:hypothetical protein